MRMSQQNVQNEIIVDLYCGIGYYTLPFLYYGHAKHVYACEWNINSIESLKYNLNKMKINNLNYTILYGNNTITTIDIQSNIADRICLGLLPSSEDGWPIAARLLKATGGMIHVHENISSNQNDIINWIEYTINKFHKYFENNNKYYDITCIHLEKVKSYAPRILHVVADLKCTPKLPTIDNINDKLIE